jgi:hypothetical protein
MPMFIAHFVIYASHSTVEVAKHTVYGISVNVATHIFTKRVFYWSMAVMRAHPFVVPSLIGIDLIDIDSRSRLNVLQLATHP